MISVLFNILFFVIPLIFYKHTSEIFEFNKIVTLYIFTALIVSAWALQSIRANKIIFRKTLLDWPLIIYLSVYLISSLLSIDPRTSWLGYYSRFNGGLISQVCYALLYWAFVSNLNKKQAQNTIYFVLISVTIVSVLAILEHFGIFTTCYLMKFDLYKSCWVQDVSLRVFSTLGQPNWLAALLIAIIPLTWAKSFKYYFLSVLFFVTLLFTKSRSGLLAFGLEFIIFWAFIFKKHISEFITLAVILVVIFFAIQSPFSNHSLQSTTSNAPALEIGGTESGIIRKYVWLGAWNVFKNHPLLGTGPETFAFSFPMYKPVRHNLTSEWDFIYNKAHNEFLNYLANTGTLCFISYISLIIFSIIIFLKSKNYGLLAGYVGLLLTNFFGFSVVSTSLLFYLFPAIAVTSSIEKIKSEKTSNLNLIQWISISVILLTTFYILYSTYLYWQADVYYNKSEYQKALLISPKEPLYLAKLSLNSNSVEIASSALNLAPFNMNVRKILMSNLITNNQLDDAEKVIIDGLKFSPVDAKLFYQLGVLQLKLNKKDEAIKNINKSIELKPNYKEGHFALGIIYKEQKLKYEAIQEFEYILKFIDSKDELTKKYLNELN